jgi:hypothetical protein
MTMVIFSNFASWLDLGTPLKIYWPLFRPQLQQDSIYHGPLCCRKHARHPGRWSTGIMPPPLDVSIASNMDTTSAISGRLSGFASQQRFITFAKELGQQRGISGLKFCKPVVLYHHPLAQNSTGNMKRHKTDLYLTNNSRCDLWEAQIRIWHITAVYLPQTDPEAIN